MAANVWPQPNARHTGMSLPHTTQRCRRFAQESQIFQALLR
jgi:hypothetical protein